jgi:hypothetical protein
MVTPGTWQFAVAQALGLYWPVLVTLTVAAAFAGVRRVTERTLSWALAALDAALGAAAALIAFYLGGGLAILWLLVGSVATGPHKFVPATIAIAGLDILFLFAATLFRPQLTADKQPRVKP